MNVSFHSQRERTTTDLGVGSTTKAVVARPVIQILKGMDAGRLIALEDGTTIIGRALDSCIILSDETVSRNHVKIQLSDSGTPVIYDLESKNGTRVNGERIGQIGTKLEEGDQIRLSTKTVLKFSWQKPVEEALQGSLYQYAVRDWLTQAHNKRYFSERFNQEFSYAARHKKPLCLLLIDIDNFKGVNDQFGHDAGDHVLKHVAQFMTEQLRNEDVLARFGGDEFAILLRQIDLAEAWLVADRLRIGIENLRLNYDGNETGCTVSIGLACSDARQYQNSTEFFVAADRALYRAKSDGRNQTIHDECSDLKAPDKHFSRRPTIPPEEI